MQGEPDQGPGNEVEGKMNSNRGDVGRVLPVMA